MARNPKLKSADQGDTKGTETGLAMDGGQNGVPEGLSERQVRFMEALRLSTGNVSMACKSCPTKTSRRRAERSQNR